MKRTIIIAGTVMLLISMLVSIGIATASDYTYNANLKIEGKGLVWVIPTGTSNPAFDGKLLIKDSIEAKVYLDADGDNVIDNADGTVIVPNQILTTEKHIMLIFNPQILPDASALKTTVTGAIQSGDLFIATGPGFTYRIK
jgi:hypothetical protein